jgi:hypothetical protein
VIELSPRGVRFVFDASTRRSTCAGPRKGRTSCCRPVHRAASLLKCQMLGAQQGAVGAEHLPAYLNEFVFRYNRRNARSVGLPFETLLRQAVQSKPSPYESVVRTFVGKHPPNTLPLCTTKGVI